MSLCLVCAGMSQEVKTNAETVDVLIDDEVFSVDRGLLVYHSDYFRRVLDPEGGFRDSGAATHSIGILTPDVFKTFVAVIELRESINDGNVAQVLCAGAALSEKVLSSAANFLASAGCKLSVYDKLMLADEYALMEVLSHLPLSISVMDRLREDDVYKILSTGTKLALLDFFMQQPASSFNNFEWMDDSFLASPHRNSATPSRHGRTHLRQADRWRLAPYSTSRIPVPIKKRHLTGASSTSK